MIQKKEGKNITLGTKFWWEDERISFEFLTKIWHLALFLAGENCCGGK